MPSVFQSLTLSPQRFVSVEIQQTIIHLEMLIELKCSPHGCACHYSYHYWYHTWCEWALNSYKILQEYSNHKVQLEFESELFKLLISRNVKNAAKVLKLLWKVSRNRAKLSVSSCVYHHKKCEIRCNLTINVIMLEVMRTGLYIKTKLRTKSENHQISSSILKTPRISACYCVNCCRKCNDILCPVIKRILFPFPR